MRNYKLALAASLEEAGPSSPILLHGDICNSLRKAATLGYDGIELHTRECATINYEQVNSICEKTGIDIVAIATGRLNTEGRCSLIDDVPYVMEAALNGLYKYIDMAMKLNADVVIGWVKGIIPANRGKQIYTDRLAKNLKVLGRYGKDRNVKLHLEVINRYETNYLFNTVEMLKFIDDYQLDNCYLHLDTFHMNIEEADPVLAIETSRDKLGYMHLADNTRHYPGSGQIKFDKIFDALDKINYKGYLSLECLPLPDGETAARNAMEYFNRIK